MFTTTSIISYGVVCRNIRPGWQGEQALQNPPTWHTDQNRTEQNRTHGRSEKQYQTGATNIRILDTPPARLHFSLSLTYCSETLLERKALYSSTTLNSGKFIFTNFFCPAPCSLFPLTYHTYIRKRILLPACVRGLRLSVGLFYLLCMYVCLSARAGN